MLKIQELWGNHHADDQCGRRDGVTGGLAGLAQRGEIERVGYALAVEDVVRAGGRV